MDWEEIEIAGKKRKAMGRKAELREGQVDEKVARRGGEVGR